MLQSKYVNDPWFLKWNANRTSIEIHLGIMIIILKKKWHFLYFLSFQILNVGSRVSVLRQIGSDKQHTITKISLFLFLQRRSKALSSWELFLWPRDWWYFHAQQQTLIEMPGSCYVTSAVKNQITPIRGYQVWAVSKCTPNRQNLKGFVFCPAETDYDILLQYKNTSEWHICLVLDLDLLSDNQWKSQWANDCIMYLCARVGHNVYHAHYLVTIHMLPI